MIDHYRTLGIGKSADQATIRSAYLTLMRRYHPDQNASHEASERAKAVSAAYVVLRDPERREAYDRRLYLSHLPQEASPSRRPPRGRNAFLVIAAATCGLLGFVLTRPAPVSVTSRPATTAPSPGAQFTQAAVERDCSGAAEADLRRAVFQQVPATAVVDGDAFKLAAAGSRVHLTGVSPEGSEAAGNLRCYANVTIKLPRGLATEQGRGTLLADVWFLPGTGTGSTGLQLETSDGLGSALASILRNQGVKLAAQAIPVPVAPANSGAPASQRRPVVQTAQPATMATPSRAAAIASEARSANRPNEQRLAERAPAASDKAASLALLERHQILLYNQSFMAADEPKRSRLMSSRLSFLERLERCSTDECRRRAYLLRNQEIVAIIRG